MSEFGKLTERKPYGFFLNTETALDLISFLRAKTPAGTLVEWLISFGAVYVGKKRQTDGHAVLKEGDVVRVHFDPKRYKVNRDDLKARIVFETEDYLIVDKPSGLPMHPTLDNLYENLISGFDFPLYVTHRLDVPTSGLVVVAKTKEYQSLFNGVVAKRQIEKTYEAVVEKKLSLGLVMHYMKASLKAPKEVVTALPEEGEDKFDECRLEIKALRPLEKKFVLDISLLTGRTHQIRAQLAALGAPILGDELYGGTPASFFGLKAVCLKFRCPKTLQPIEVSTPGFATI